VAKHGRGYVLGVTSGQRLYWLWRDDLDERRATIKMRRFVAAG
jgi:hypothetical protein